MTRAKKGRGKLALKSGSKDEGKDIDEFSGFATKKEWIVKDMNDGTVICRDDKGLYRTMKNLCGCNMIDGYRCYRRTELGPIPEEVW